MKIGVVSAMLINNAEMMRLTHQWAESVRSSHELSMYAMVNGLKAFSVDQLEKGLRLMKGDLKIFYDTERSVAGSWNHGIRAAIADGCELIAVCGNDTVLSPDAMDIMAEFGVSPANHNISAWSGCTAGHADGAVNYDAGDCSFFMIRPWTIIRHGTFDENLKPAYYEDNDMYARIVLGGGECASLHKAKFFHYGSMTTKTDPDLARKVQTRFVMNSRYFQQKWGVDRPATDARGVTAHYYKTPWDSEDKGLDWWPPL